MMKKNLKQACHILYFQHLQVETGVGLILSGASAMACRSSLGNMSYDLCLDGQKL
jgi:hypothetical protein